MRAHRFIAGLALLLGLVPFLRGHYLWLGVDRKAGEKDTVNLYFEEGPRAGNGRYLDPFVKRGKTWIRTPAAPKPTELKMSEVKTTGKRWLRSELSTESPRALSSFCTFGVYRYPRKLDVLLHYHAKHYEVKKVSDLKKLARSEHLTVDIVPTVTEKGLQLQVLWNGKPAANRTIVVRYPVRKNLKTDAEGKATLEVTRKGRYQFRTYVEEKKKGTYEGKEHTVIRYHCSLSIRLPIK